MFFDGITISSIPEIDGVEALKETLKANIQERLGNGAVKNPCCLNWTIDKTKSEEAYSVTFGVSTVAITAGGIRGLFYGTGKFLRAIDFTEDGFSFENSNIESSPECSLRGIYFATHFLNWYQMASEKELERYVGELAFWGINSISVVYPFLHLDEWNNPETEKALAQVTKVLNAADKFHMNKALIVVPNQLFRTAPEEFRAQVLPDPLKRRGNLGRNLCPCIPAAEKYMLDNYDILFGKLRAVGLDILTFWPYDEGGCSCEKCFPWGANGYLTISKGIAKIARRYFPDLKVNLSTWCFDTPEEGEWKGLAKYLETHKWIDYIQADAHEDFPQYPLKNGVPGNLPLINFPEISMWGLSPWGGYGATPLPKRFERLWCQIANIADGGFAYSEGIFEDINKFAVSQFYWYRKPDLNDVLKEYISFYFSKNMCADIIKIIGLVETTHTDPESPAVSVNIKDAHMLAEKVDAALPERARKSWRWRILFIRTLLDVKRFSTGGLKTAEAIDAMKELIEIYHAQKAKEGFADNPQHAGVRPPLN